MARVLHAPDWRSENLPRLRDLVDQQLAALRNTVQGAEESWVNDPANAWRMQRQPGWLASASFLTRTHNALRLRWQLLDPAPGDGEALAAFLTRLAESGRTPRPRAPEGAARRRQGAGLGRALAAAAHARRRGAARPRPEPGRDARREPGRRLRLPRAGPARRPGDAGERGAGEARGAAQAPAARRRRAHVPGFVAGDARRARPAARVVRGAAGRQPPPFAAAAAGGRAADRRAPAPARRAGVAAARRPACAEQAGRRDPHLGARGALRRRRRQGQAARLPVHPPLRRRRLARHLLQDRRRRPRLQQRPARLGLVGPASATTPSARPSCRRRCASSSA